MKKDRGGKSRRRRRRNEVPFRHFSLIFFLGWLTFVLFFLCLSLYVRVYDDLSGVDHKTELAVCVRWAGSKWKCIERVSGEAECAAIRKGVRADRRWRIGFWCWSSTWVGRATLGITPTSDYLPPAHSLDKSTKWWSTLIDMLLGSRRGVLHSIQLSNYHSSSTWINFPVSSVTTNCNDHFLIRLELLNQIWKSHSKETKIKKRRKLNEKRSSW